jgi:twitching motility protein PilU
MSADSPEMRADLKAAGSGSNAGAAINIKPLFKLMVQKQASDLFFTPFAPIKIKIEGKIFSVNDQSLTNEMVRDLAYGLMTQEQINTFNEEREIDFALSESGLGRFRVNVFHQRGNPAMVLRYITLDMPRIDNLGLPAQLKDLVMHKRGLILMVGATGCGKTTTLAAMINYRNENSAGHIITIEDPIEFLHSNKQSIVNQREIGLDTKSYSNALHSAMRSAPDVILIGEIHDRKTMQSALMLAATGHLVLATLHANNASETIDRVINMFPHEQHKQVCLDLSQYLRAIIAQRLVPGKSRRRLAAVELLVNTPHIQQLIKNADIMGVKEALTARTDKSIQDFDSALYQLYKEERITLEDALIYADSRANLEAKINFG